MKCAHENCNANATGQSKYCTAHKKEARARFLAMIKEKGEERSSQKGAIRNALAAAHRAGLAALAAKVPTPMVVTQRIDPLDDQSEVEKAWIVPGGVCGFAYVTLRGARGVLATEAKDFGFRSAYRGGLEMSVRGGGQSMEQKAAYAEAFARSMQEQGYEGFSWYDRMD